MENICQNLKTRSGFVVLLMCLTVMIGVWPGYLIQMMDNRRSFTKRFCSSGGMSPHVYFSYYKVLIKFECRS